MMFILSWADGQSYYAGGGLNVLLRQDLLACLEVQWSQ
jgi:hypothetical protein